MWLVVMLISLARLDMFPELPFADTILHWALARRQGGKEVRRSAFLALNFSNCVCLYHTYKGGYSALCTNRGFQTFYQDEHLTG